MLTDPTSTHRTSAPPAKKKSQPNAKHTHVKQLKFVSHTCSTTSLEHSSAATVFHKLDLTIPEQKRKMEQRQKMVSYGKNTCGYAEYIQQVPKEKRMKRSMETPMTPDYTLDIPNKRWQGQIRAWRLALHKYDPPDLQASLASVASSAAVTNGSEESPTRAVPPTSEGSIRDQQLVDAKKRGLLVDMGGGMSMTATKTKTSPTSVFFMEDEALVQDDMMKELDLWETSGTHVDEFDCDDSDDELL